MKEDSKEEDARLHRLTALVTKLGGELESLREEGRIVSETLVANARVKAARAKRAQRSAERAHESAEARANSTSARVARKRR